MTDKALLRAVPDTPRLRSVDGASWSSPAQEIVVGKDVLELLSTSMYVDALTIYREYTQNAADAIDQAREQGSLGQSDPGSVSITIDSVARSIRIRDNGTGIAWRHFAERLSNLGASTKRGTTARGFRGVGRLAGLGYCQELIFRSRTTGESSVSELRWDCRALKSALRSSTQERHLVALVQEIVSVRRSPLQGYPERFFEVELKGVIRHRDDRLLNPVAVGDYLSQVSPVPFSPDFKFGAQITAALRPHVRLGELDIRINGAEKPLYRPHRNEIPLNERESGQVTSLEVRQLTSVEGSVAALAWILHHDYSGAIPAAALVKGLRLRTGNMQVGDNALLEDLFPESRFNAWAVGEVHVVDTKVLPNGRRDHFEQSVHFDNLLTQMTPIAREIAQRCRHSSIARKWMREFELHQAAAVEAARIVKRGGLTRAAREAHTDSVAKSLKAMHKVVETRHLGEDTRATLETQAVATEVKIKKLLGMEASEQDPLLRYKPQIRTAYQHLISLVYDCSMNRAAAGVLVEKILARLTSESNPKKSVARKSRLKK
jgi:Histidine kinase-, DNA gyrase B-, and HSP90-like ATPase